jgi:hypothetical protein
MALIVSPSVEAVIGPDEVSLVCGGTPVFVGSG